MTSGYDPSGIHAYDDAEFGETPGAPIRLAKYKLRWQRTSEALTLAVKADGRSPLSRPLNAGGHHLANAGPGVRADHSATVGQLRQGSTWCGTSGGTAAAYTLDPQYSATAALPALNGLPSVAGQPATAVFTASQPPADGCELAWTVHATVASNATLAVNGLAAVPLQRPDGSPVVAGDLQAGALAVAKRVGGGYRLVGGMAAGGAGLSLRQAGDLNRARRESALALAAMVGG